ncbi:MAG: hypothetical protein GEU99_23490 [Luteitalea sp.]|nr:hypothetical protein [Luteitalea sp.]
MAASTHAGTDVVFRDAMQPGPKLADADLIFTAGPLAGTRLVGFAVWNGREGLNVGLPGRTFETQDGQTKRYDLIRTVSDGDFTGIMHLKQWIREQYEATHPE